MREGMVEPPAKPFDPRQLQSASLKSFHVCASQSKLVVLKYLVISTKLLLEWRNWYTRWSQKPVRATW